MLAAAALLGGCTSLQMPYAPGPLLVPSSTADPDGRLAPTFDLTGALDADGDLTATVHTELRLGEVNTSPDMLAHRPGWETVRLTLDGSVTVTNTADRPNRAVGSVYYQILLAYPRDSTVCRREARSDERDAVVGRLCWVVVGSATPFSYVQDHHGAPTALAPRASRTRTFGTGQGSGLWLTVPFGEVETAVTEIRSPVAAVATTNEIDLLGQPYTFVDACRGPRIDEDRREQINQVGASRPFTCRELPTR